MDKYLDILNWVAMLLVVIGGLNWGLFGLLDLDLVDMIFGSIPLVAQLVYVLVGLSAIYVGATYLPKFPKVAKPAQAPTQ